MSNETIIIGFEGSANKLGVGIITSKGTVLSNERITYSPAPGEGFLPAKIAEHHADNILALTKASLTKANISKAKIDLIAYTRGPGIGSSLSVVSVFVHSFATLINKPIVPVNHCIAHIEMGIQVTKAANPLIVYVSGGNSQLLFFHEGKYRILAETLDSAIGNVIDKMARKLSLPNAPAPGYNVELLARKYSNKINNNDELCLKEINKEKISIATRGWDTALTGIVDNIECKIRKLLFPSNINNNKKTKSEVEIPEEVKEKYCYLLQESLFGKFAEVCDRILNYLKSDNLKNLKGFKAVDGILLTGGVGCNVRFQEVLKEIAVKHELKMFDMDDSYCIDNGLMIAWAGWLHFKENGGIDKEEINVVQKWRTDTVDVNWK